MKGRPSITTRISTPLKSAGTSNAGRELLNEGSNEKEAFFARIVNLFQVYEGPNKSIGKGERIFDLLLISFLSLFFETLVIRWLSTELRLFAYFKNLALIACFIGLGIGFALSERKFNLFHVFPSIFCLFSGIVLLGTSVSKALFATGESKLPLIYPGLEEEFIWHAYSRSFIFSILFFYGAIVFVFCFNIIVFLPLGQAMGRMMREFAPIRAYTINIFGSLLGVWAFALVSFLYLPPIYWFGLGLALSLWFLRRRRSVLLINALICGLFLLLVYFGQGGALWSPYYRIDVMPIENVTDSGEKVRMGYRLDVNYDFHQHALNLDPDFTTKYFDLFPRTIGSERFYNLPYSFAQPKEVLVVGAGMGNDVAAALRHGIEKVDAVEIDPLIVDLGKRLHPEKPYQSSKVNIIVDDARSFFKKSDKRYDMIVFGFLDSHTLFSSMSSLRLDNFVYTVESFQEAEEHLKDNGVLCLTFAVPKEWIGLRLFRMLEAVFGQKPLVLGGLTFIAGLSDKTYEQLQPWADDLTYDEEVPMAVDDWPYLYMKDRKIPSVYWQVLLVLAAISLVAILWVFPESTRLNWHFFFLGSAFLLIEIKGITDMALLFGSTWIVNSIVISSVLMMILLANLYVSKIEINNAKIYYIPLIASLLLSYLVPLGSLLGQNLWLKGIISSLIVSAPLFFAGIIFAASLNKTRKIEMAFGSNLLGAVVGGLLEYASLVYGFRSLILVAMLLYALSFSALFIKSGD